MQQQQQRSRATRWSCARLALLLLAGEAAQTALAQLSKPVASDKHWEEQGHNKFLQRKADNDKDGESQCVLCFACCCRNRRNRHERSSPRHTHHCFTRFEEFAAAGGAQNICPLDIELKWMTEVSSSVYATPLITDLYADGRKDVIVPGESWGLLGAGGWLGCWVVWLCCGLGCGRRVAGCWGLCTQC
jgi:hypothetical protein